MKEKSIDNIIKQMLNNKDSTIAFPKDTVSNKNLWEIIESPKENAKTSSLDDLIKTTLFDIAPDCKDIQKKLRKTI